MPLFFMIGGFFIKFNLSFKEFIFRDFKRLMIPYFIFAFIGLIAEVLKRIALHRESLNYLREIKGILFGMDMDSLLNHYGFVLWFLPALFFSRILLFTLQKITTNLFYNFILVLLLFTASFYFKLPFAIDKALNASLWVYLGFVFFKFQHQRSLLYVLPFVPILILPLLGIPALDMAQKYYSNIFANIPWALAIIYILVLVFKKTDYSEKISNLLSLWGGGTMLLFIIHPYTNNIAHLIVEKLHFGNWYLKLIISLILLKTVLILGLKYRGRGIFKYV